MHNLSDSHIPVFLSVVIYSYWSVDRSLQMKERLLRLGRLPNPCRRMSTVVSKQLLQRTCLGPRLLLIVVSLFVYFERLC